MDTENTAAPTEKAMLPVQVALSELEAAEDAALNVDALLNLLEDAAWATVNHTQAGRPATVEDAARAASVHTAIMMAKKQFDVCYAGISAGQHFVSREVRALEGGAA